MPNAGNLEHTEPYVRLMAVVNLDRKDDYLRPILQLHWKNFVSRGGGEKNLPNDIVIRLKNMKVIEESDK